MSNTVMGPGSGHDLTSRLAVQVGGAESGKVVFDMRFLTVTPFAGSIANFPRIDLWQALYKKCSLMFS